MVVFVEYPPDPKGYMPKPEERQHANTAKGIKSVWIAVTDLKAATKAYESVGLPVGEKRRLPQLGAIGSEIKAGQGVILLLQPTSHSGKVAKFLEDRGEGIMGISIEVSRLMTARKLLQMNTKRKFTPYGGPYGMSVLIPAQITHGVWVEMFQRR